MANAFVPLALDILRLRASKGDPDGDYHVKWSLEYDVRPLGDSSLRVVFGTLHAAGELGWGDITVAAMFSNTLDLDDDEAGREIAHSDAAESLFDFARSHLRGLLASVGGDVEIPRKAPEPEFVPFDSSTSLSDDVATAEDTAEGAEVP